MAHKKEVGFIHSDYFYNDLNPHQSNKKIKEGHNPYFHYGNKTLNVAQAQSWGSGVFH